MSEVYPRVCGGTGLRRPGQRVGEGLSPRVRGNRGLATPPPNLRSIPACAGEPGAPIAAGADRTVYPRVCGGTVGLHRPRAGAGGLSPRVRGNRRRSLVAPPHGWSIPACAGEPERARRSQSKSMVYPRVCGGTTSTWQKPAGLKGLSPRVRGNRINDIPDGPTVMVYPRVCGGTRRGRRPASYLEGLSPRVRGNPVRKSPHHRAGRSIPACAGEPVLEAHQGLSHTVYPRVCGGTTTASLPLSQMPGLSPRVRGNRVSPLAVHEGGRSIPACAGEPPVSP